MEGNEKNDSSTSSTIDSDEDRNAAEASLVRGVFRSVSRFPAVGQLPRTAGTAMPRSIATAIPKVLPNAAKPTFRMIKALNKARPISVGGRSAAVRAGRGMVRRRVVPVKHVARISDRVSQGLDVYGIASSSSNSHEPQQPRDDTTTTTTQQSQWSSRVARFVTSESLRVCMCERERAAMFGIPIAVQLGP